MDYDRLSPWISLLRSPGGLHTLSLSGDHLVDSAGREYAFVQGIPRLLPEGDPGKTDSHWNRFYDLWAPFYNFGEMVGTRLLLGIPNLQEVQRRLVERLPISSGSTLLEVSPGPAVYLPHLAQAVGANGRIAAVDLSMGMLQQSRKRTRKLRPPSLLVQGNGSALPFADESFDFLFHFGGIKLFTDPQHAYREFARVVRPGGLLFVGDEGVAAETALSDRRRRILTRLNPGYLTEMPDPPASLRILRKESVYSGYAFLLTLQRL